MFKDTVLLFGIFCCGLTGSLAEAPDCAPIYLYCQERVRKLPVQNACSEVFDQYGKNVVDACTTPQAIGGKKVGNCLSGIHVLQHDEKCRVTIEDPSTN